MNNTIYKLAKKFEKKIKQKSRSNKNMSRDQLLSHLDSLSNQHSMYRKALQKAQADLKKAQEDLDHATEMAEATRQDMEKYHKMLQNMNLAGGKKVIQRKDVTSYLTDDGDMVVDESAGVLPYKEWKKILKNKDSDDSGLTHDDSSMAHGDGCDCGLCGDMGASHDDGCDCGMCGDMNMAHGDGCDCGLCEP